MNLQPKDDLDRVIDETLASMVAAEPHRVNAASVRQGMGESRGSSLAVWLAVAAVLIVGLAVVLRARAPLEETPVNVARSVQSHRPIEIRPDPSTDAAPATSAAPGRAMTTNRLAVATTTEPAYEGFARLAIPSIDIPEPLSTSRLAADPIQIPSIDLAPLSVSTLSDEQVHN